MAADTRVSVEDTGCSYPATKIFRIGQSLFGTAGHGTMCLVMIEWLKTARNRQTLYKQWADYEREQIWLLELNPKGLFLWDGWGCPEQVHRKNFAIGSGAKAALALLDKGDAPEDAVKGAAHYDIYTAPPVQCEYLLPPELLKRTKRKRG
jgi:ATP-dependent protease HslVU (ClpYQ) peptidase subunit